MTADEYEQLPPEEKEHFGELGDNPRNACNTWQLQGKRDTDNSEAHSPTF
jgi:hypothetical protein